MKNEFIELDEDFKVFKQNPNNLLSIQYLRAIAVIAVLFAHLHAVEAKLGQTIIFGNWALNGFFGVDIFFVISGFIMVWITRKQKPSIAAIPKFWILRIFRIYPLWILICGAIYIVWLYQPDWVYKSHASNPNILKSLLLLPDKDLPLHAVGWTLIHELWFYMIFSLFLLFPRKYLIILLSLWASVLVFFAIIGFKSSNPNIALITSPLGLEFIIGAFIALNIKLLKKINSRTLIIVAGIGFLIAIANSNQNPSSFFASEIQRVLWYSIPSALLLIGIFNSEAEGIKPNKTMTNIGNWSYAIYLIHVPVFAVLGRIISHFTGANFIVNLCFGIMALFAAIIAGMILNLLFEKPIMRFAHSIINPKK